MSDARKYWLNVDWNREQEKFELSYSSVDLLNYLFFFTLNISWSNYLLGWNDFFFHIPFQGDGPKKTNLLRG